MSAVTYGAAAECERADATDSDRTGWQWRGLGDSSMSRIASILCVCTPVGLRRPPSMILGAAVLEAVQQAELRPLGAGLAEQVVTQVQGERAPGLGGGAPGP